MHKTSIKRGHPEEVDPEQDMDIIKYSTTKHITKCVKATQQRSRRTVEYDGDTVG